MQWQEFLVDKSQLGWFQTQLVTLLHIFLAHLRQFILAWDRLSAHNSFFLSTKYESLRPTVHTEVFNFWADESFHTNIFYFHVFHTSSRLVSYI